MSYLDKLLQGVEVEWKTLGEVAELKRGTTITRNTSKEGKYPVISGGQQPAYFIDQFNRDGETITVAGSGAYAGFVMYWNEPIFVSDAFSIKADESKVFPRYIFHYLLNIQDKIHDLQAGGGVPHVYAKDVARFHIPIPPLPVQEKIVGILDKFTELTAELTARKQQYNYYREQLLSFEEGEVEWKSLRQLTSLITKGTTPKNYTDKGIAFIKTEAFDGTYINPNKLSFVDEETHDKELKRSILNHNDILITIAGATIGKCAIVPKEILPANTNQALAIIRLNPDVNLKYVFHLIKSNYLTKYIEQNIKGSAQPNLNLEQLNNFTIPYPSPEEQERIVSILDKFDILTTSISEGLPKEIELRKKQYEYYRDRLLTFK